MKTFEITKEQILELADQHSWSENKLKDWFPEAFKTELEVGKWYKVVSNGKTCLFNHQPESSSYGFWRGVWKSGSWSTNSEDFACDNIELATEEEVKTALIEEAKRRGYVGNFKVKPLWIGHTYWDCADTQIRFYENTLYFSSAIFHDGVWAEIIPQEVELTLEQIAEKFNIDVKQLKIKK